MEQPRSPGQRPDDPLGHKHATSDHHRLIGSIRENKPNTNSRNAWAARSVRDARAGSGPRPSTGSGANPSSRWRRSSCCRRFSARDFLFSAAPEFFSPAAEPSRLSFPPTEPLRLSLFDAGRSSSWFGSRGARWAAQVALSSITSCRCCSSESSPACRASERTSWIEWSERWSERYLRWTRHSSL